MEECQQVGHGLSLNLASELQPLEGPGEVPAQPLPGAREVEHSCHFQGAFCSLVVRAHVPVLPVLAGLCRVSGGPRLETQA